MIERNAVIKNHHGIHCRPSAVIMKAIEGYTGKIIIFSDGEPLVLESIFSLLSLGLKPGDPIQIRVEGPDEEESAGKLVNLFEYEFDFPPKEEKQHFNPEELAKNYKLV